MNSIYLCSAEREGYQKKKWKVCGKPPARLRFVDTVEAAQMVYVIGPLAEPQIREIEQARTLGTPILHMTEDFIPLSLQEAVLEGRLDLTGYKRTGV